MATNHDHSDVGTVLVVDDDVKIVNLVAFYLRRDGHSVITAVDGVKALSLARAKKPDLIILDLLLPGIGGMELCRMIRATVDTPIIMLTARTAEEARIAGLDAGADDYVVKPFSPGELAARARAVLRRSGRMPGGTSGSSGSSGRLQIGPISLNLREYTTTVNDRPVTLTNTEFRLLAKLMGEPNRPFTRAQLSEDVLGDDHDGSDRIIDVHILNLRRKIEPDRSHPVYITTVFGVGYKFSV